MTRNSAASVRQRLRDRAKREHRLFDQLLQYYAMERFLYRLSRSAHAERYILKGALMLRVWNSPEFRPTMDIDMLGITANDEKNIISQVRDVIGVEVEPDGLVFDADSIAIERITENADYQGVRVRFKGYLERARISMQLDIGFGDRVYPQPLRCQLPAMLDFEGATLLCYSRESVIAEKFEAMVKLGELNSRMKDFYDIWLLSNQCTFERATLMEAIRQTFEQRGTVLEVPIEAFSAAFAAAHQVQWKSFCRKLNQEHIPVDFGEVVGAVARFVAPGLESTTSVRSWQPGGPWV